MTEFRIYKGEELFSLKFQKRPFLVDKLIREKDSIILVGDSKAGKSIFMFQLICSLTSQLPFLDKYDILRPLKVLYVQLEGELEDSYDRFERLKKSLDINSELFSLGYLPPLSLENLGVAKKLEADIRNVMIPDVLIIDPIYAACLGDLSNNDLVRRFLGNLRIIKQSLNTTLILVHHTSKLTFNSYGEPIDKGDKGLFGSTFFQAFPDHVLLLTLDRKSQIRTLTCKTQRSGDIEEEIHLKLIQPDPLYFQVTEEIPADELAILEVLRQERFKDGLSIDQLCKETQLSRTSVYRSIKIPLSKNLIIKGLAYPRIYKAV